MKQITYNLEITGIVQGVGFRPFLYNLARNHDLKGVILNRGNAGVSLTLQGNREDFEEFIDTIKEKKPSISYIEKLTVNEIKTDETFTDLRIEKSEEGRGISLTLPPDVAICDDCLRDMRNPELQKYYNYPFIACAVCGPRFTTVKELPYDRERSTMTKFPFCKEAKPESCMVEYSDFQNRRFHAQTFACSVCGPNYQLYNKSKNLVKTKSIDEILKLTAKRIKEGEVAAIKGIGGVHLVCLANGDKTILKLRRKKGKRKHKPFALMVPNLNILENYLKISDRERALLTSFRRPIVLLEKNRNFSESNISELVAPGLNNVGIMLPYSGIHYLLFDHIGEQPLVYTSGNKSNIPMAIENEKIFDQLNNLADFFLLHNRPIYQRADDSVLRIHDDRVKLIRRSRGYVPEYFALPFEVKTPAAISTGPELTVTGSILRKNRIFPTQHIGNVTHLETYEFLNQSLFHMKKLLQIKDSEIEFIACDLHPNFTTTKLALELANQYSVETYPIQHHYAHILSLMVENEIDPEEKIVGISVDGVGYGDDGNIWGGEILLSGYDGYERSGQLQYQPMIGGDRCTKFPARMAASIILNFMELEESKKIFEKISIKNDLEYEGIELNAIISQFEHSNESTYDQNIPLTSSAGRIFDAISYLLGASNIKTYRGEPAMRLEGFASKGNPDKIELEIKYYKKNGRFFVNTSDLVGNVLNLIKNSNNNRHDIAAKFHKVFAEAFADIAILIADLNNINKVGLTGGVAYNRLFSSAIKKTVQKNGLIFLEHNSIPPGDAGISIGQLIGGLYKNIS
ncbi:MAG: carbamoyltransferase HypF [Candidatus Lokiarchaeota archaeon]|nr:carbamoyltransferase HypF [Candidatus Lokiarchaeota archaeon]